MIRQIKSNLYNIFRRAFPARPMEAGAGSTSGSEKKLLAVFTMVHNEHRMLPVWTRHYLKQVGAGNLYVLDHGSDHLPTLPGCQVVPVERRDLDEIDRAKQVENFQKVLLEKYRFVLFTDCDEFVVARPSHYLSLADYAQTLRTPTVRCMGIDVIEHAAGLPPVHWNQPILMQRPYGALRFWSCKTLLSSVPLTWQPGFHVCEEPSTLDRNLWMFHLKYADKSHLLERLQLTRGLAWSPRAHALGHGGSHRVSDAAMMNFLVKFQQSRQESYLETLDMPATVEGNGESALHRIPEIFLKAF